MLSLIKNYHKYKPQILKIIKLGKEMGGSINLLNANIKVGEIEMIHYQERDVKSVYA